MNRALLMIMIPAAAVTAFYLIVLRHVGRPLNLLRVCVAVAAFLAAVWMVRRKSRGNT
ncbi:MAG TPA: hypothetical protein VEH49_03320 [Methylomirabilota bacterium]|nr:hypothetical protein [Methylomirabilota bacterium]